MRCVNHRIHRYVAFVASTILKTLNELLMIPVSNIQQKQQQRPRKYILLQSYQINLSMKAPMVFISVQCLNPWDQVLIVWFDNPFWMAKRILRQALQDLEFLHQNGIAHGDFQPSHILFTLEDLNHIGDSKMKTASMDRNLLRQKDQTARLMNGLQRILLFLNPLLTWQTLSSSRQISTLLYSIGFLSDKSSCIISSSEVMLSNTHNGVGFEQ